MIAFIRKRLELKIIITLAAVIALAVGVSTYVDILHVRSDMIRTSERTLGAFAAAIKASVSASMKKGQHDVIPQILREVHATTFIDRLTIYNEQGRPLQGRETLHEQDPLDMTLSPDILRSVAQGDVSEVRELAGKHFISYYAPLLNGTECHRCHGTEAQLNGILRIDFSLSELADLLQARRNRDVAWSGGLILMLVGVLAVLLRKVVHTPVRELRHAMVGAADGRGAGALVLTGDDELGDLKRSFVSMLERISTLHQVNLDKEVQLAHAHDLARFRMELQVMFDAMPDAVLMVDRDLRVVQSNRRVQSLLPDMVNDEPVASLAGAFPEDGLRRGILRAVRDGKGNEQQVAVTTPSGGTRHLHAISAPVIEHGRTVYVVQVVRDITGRIRTERELEQRTAELRRTNRLLARLAVTDSLTQLYNRRHFDELLAKEIKRYNRRKYTSLSLMMIDIDHFKPLNDRYGHLAGDNVLRELATVLKQEVRETDAIARYGGEEFVVVMPDTSVDGAGYKADMLRRRVQDMEFPGHDQPLRITVSIGVAEYIAGFPRDLVHAADKALYQAKQGGRNTVVLKRRDEVDA